MTLDRLGRWRLPAIALAALALALAVVAVILLPGQLTAPDSSPSATSTSEPSATASPGGTPEAAVRDFFEAFAQAGETNDPSIIEPFVTSTDSSAYQTAAAFLRGQEEVGKASITTVNELSDFEVTIDGDRATVEFTYVAGGYDIDAATGEPLESPVVLPAERVRVVVLMPDDRWLVDSYEAVR